MSRNRENPPLNQNVAPADAQRLIVISRNPSEWENVLLNILTKRGVHILLVRQAADALVQLATNDIHSIVTVGQNEISYEADMLETIATHWPTVELWRYLVNADENNGQLLRDQTLSNNQLNNTPEMLPFTNKSNQELDTTDIQADSTSGAFADRVLVTEAEMEMLLGPIAENS